MKKRILIFTILFLTLLNAYGQRKEKIWSLSLHFEHSLRIPYHDITIEFFNRKDEVAIEINSKPMNNDKKWEYSKIDTSFIIPRESFQKILVKAEKLKEIDVGRAFVLGTDGISCAIKVGGFGNSITYQFWSPDAGTKARGLEDFLDLYKDILKLAGFDPKEIL